jgi:catechol 2,3-dioxygenase-like lactoylglutathione lyase family enzyme
VGVLSSRILLRPGDLDRSRRFYRDLPGLAVYRDFGLPDDPGLVFSPARGYPRSPGTRPASRALGDDLDPGPRGARQARPAGRSRSPGRAGTGSRAVGPERDDIEDPDGTRIVLAEVPADHPLRNDPRPALPPGRRTACRIPTAPPKRAGPASAPGTRALLWRIAAHKYAGDLDAGMPQPQMPGLVP